MEFSKFDFQKLDVRQMGVNDWYFISKIYEEGIVSKKATIVKELPTIEQWSNNNSLCLVAEYCGNIVGFVSLNRNDISELSIYVKSEFKGLGIGKKLIFEIKKIYNKNIKSLIFEDNEHSINLHKKSGFIKTGVKVLDNDKRSVLIYEWSPQNG
jgi:L-amino acid N-acyltransferase YncA